MEYSEDLQENERQKEANGQRDIITLEQYEAWASDIDGFNIEVLLDIANGMYSLKDFIQDVREYERN